MVETATAPVGAEGRYWEALREGRLELPCCAQCGHWHWPAVFRCGECGSWDQEWHEQPLAGTVFAWTRTHQNFGNTDGIEKPFVSVLVTLDTVPIRLLGIVEGNSANVAIGMRASGRISTTEFSGSQIPSIRWELST